MKGETRRPEVIKQSSDFSIRLYYTYIEQRGVTYVTYYSINHRLMISGSGPSTVESREYK